MKKLVLLTIIFFTINIVHAQIRLLFEQFTVFDQALYSDDISAYSITTFYTNPNTPTVRDSSTNKCKIYRNINGKVDSILSGYHFKFSNDTISIDTIFITDKSIGEHFGDSSVYIEYHRNGNTWEPKYRMTVVTENKKIKHYYGEYYQSIGGWDGRKNFYVCKSGNGKDFYSVSSYYIDDNNITWKDSINRYFNNDGTILVDSNYNVNLSTPRYAMYTYPSLKNMVATYYSNNIATGLVRSFNFDSNGHINQMIQIEHDTIVLIVSYINGPSANTGLTQLKQVSNLNIYPNPVNSVLNIGIKAKQIAIIDITGKPVLTISDLTTNQINVGGLKSGLYFISATDLSGNVYKSKFVKE